MRNLVSEYVNQFRQDRQKQVKLAAVLAALAVVVAGVVFWQLHNTGVAMTNEVYCGMEEHTHNDSCYEQELICTSEDPDHVHNESCYATVLVCDLPEHTHTVECLVDETADVETADVWEDTLPVLSGIWADDVASIAESQVGYTESEANYVLAEDGTTHQGYNRYGAWYGNEYGDWDAMFASFCLNYAGVPEEEVPENSGAYALAVALYSEDLYMESSTGFTPQTGDLIFFDGDQDEQADRVGVVIEANEDELIVVEGDCEDAVVENTYENDEPEILAYGLLPEQDLSPEAGMYSISYSGEIPGGVEVEGPIVAQEGTNQYFYVTVAEDYEINEVTANGEELTKIDIDEAEDGESVTYTYILEDISGDTIVELDATQVLKGSGRAEVTVYHRIDNGGYTEDKETYTLTVTDVPTNTMISLSSPSIALKDSSGNDIEEDLALEGNLYYLEEGAVSGSLVSYLMLDDDLEEDDSGNGEYLYVLTPYGENNEPYNLSTGKLVFYSPVGLESVNRAQIWQIQTNMLCELDEKGNYQQKLVEAVVSFNPIMITIENYGNGDEVKLADLVSEMSKDSEYYSDFYYGSAEDPSSLKSCTYGKIVDDELLPLDKDGNPVSGVSIYVEYDRVYSFDVEINSVVNEHTEDNGDTYLWLGDTFYIDQYHAQGDDVIGYTRSQNTLSNCGVWVQLGRIREGTINGGTKNFNDYSNVSYSDMLAEGVSLTGYDSANAAGTAEANAPYGIAGPYKFENGETDVETTTVRVTGHVGDEFTQTEAFGDEVVYMIKENQELQKDWFNLGSHASDNGYRAWFYWITDYYVLNNHQDEVEYVVIREDENTGEIRLLADDMGSSGTGEQKDIWDITGLYTKRYSVVKDYMLKNMETLKDDGVGFYEHAGEMGHIQLRTNTTVEDVINGVVYNGTFQLIYEYEEEVDDDGNVTRIPFGKSPFVQYKIKREATTLAGEEYKELGEYLTGETYLLQDNDQETKQYTFEYEYTVDGVTYTVPFYVKSDYAEDPESVSITVTVYATGTLVAQDGTGETIHYGKGDKDDPKDPLEYTTTLTAEQLKEAIDDCPNNEGYDVAINLADAIKLDNEVKIVLQKIWDDDNNSHHSRDYVTYVTVSLEYSKDGETWYPVTVDNDPDLRQAFTIRGDKNSYVWSLTLTSEDLNLTYRDDNDGSTREYEFRIAEEQDIVGVTEGFEYTYTLDDELTLVVMNSLSYTFDISGEKAWYDGDKVDENGDPVPLDPDDTRIPESLTIGVFQNDEFYAMTTADRDSNWSFSFVGLPQSVYGGEDVYTYTLYELDEYGNRVDDDGFILIDGLLYHVGIKQTDPPEGSEDPDIYYVQLSNAVYTAELPNTGGTGTWLYTVIGVCLFGGAAGTLVYRKRRAVRS